MLVLLVQSSCSPWASERRVRRSTSYDARRNRRRSGWTQLYIAARRGLSDRCSPSIGALIRALGTNPPVNQDIAQLRRSLKAAVEKEDYEQAARLRDEIRRPEERTGEANGAEGGGEAN